MKRYALLLLLCASLHAQSIFSFLAPVTSLSQCVWPASVSVGTAVCTIVTGPNSTLLAFAANGGPFVVPEQGPAGATGPVGPSGAQGIAGAAGPPGAVGPEGPQGQAGITGAPGAQGPQGIPGQTGATGVAGAQGPIGLTGQQGAQGVPGPPGPGLTQSTILFVSISCPKGSGTVPAGFTATNCTITVTNVN
jgi:hypothetical protein